MSLSGVQSADACAAVTCGKRGPFTRAPPSPVRKRSFTCVPPSPARRRSFTRESLSLAQREAFSAAGSLLGGGGLFSAPSSRKMFEPCGVSSLHWGRVGRGDAIHWVAAWPMLKGGGSADVLAWRAARLRCWAACAFSPLGTSAPCSSGSWVYWSTSPYPRAHGCFCTSLGHVRSGSVSR